MTESETVALNPTSELPIVPLAHQSHNPEYELEIDKSVESRWKEIVKNIDAAHDVIINELPDIEKVVAGIPVKLTLDCSTEGGYVNYSVAVYFTVEGNRIQANLESDSPMGMFGNKLGEAVTKELYDYIRTPDFQKEIDVRNKATERLSVANEAKKIHVQSNFKGFEGIMIPYGYRFGDYFACEVKTYTKTDNTGKEVEEEKLTPIGNCCAVTTRFRVDGATKVMQRVRFITVNGDIKDVDAEIGELSDLRSLNNFARTHGLYIINAPEFKSMLDKQFTDGVNSNKLPIIEATTSVGWHGDAFVSGRDCYGGNIICVNAEARDKWYKEGTLDGWMEGIKGLVNFPEVRLAMGLEIAAMIISRIGVAPFTVLIHGKTSKIKSTRLKVAHSIRGNPTRILQNMEGSKTSPDKTVKESNDSTVTFDEVKNEVDIKKANDINKIVPNGKSRSRYNVKTDKNDSTDFSCIVFFTAERPIFDVSTYHGSRVRCMVLKTRENFPDIPEEVEAFESLVASKSTTDTTLKNFGHIGPLVYDVIMKHPALRADFDAIKAKFEPTTAIENRIADMQAATALGMELLEEVFKGLRGNYSWLQKMDSVQVVKDQTAEYVNESTVPEWEPQLQHLLSKVDFDRRYLDPDPIIDTDDEGNKTERKKEGTYPVKGYRHKIGGDDYLLLNGVETDEYLKKKGMDPETLFSGVRDNTEILKTYPKKNKKGELIKGGLKIQNPQKDSIPGGMVYALSIDKLREWVNVHHEEEEEDVNVKEEIEAINAREKDSTGLLASFYRSNTKITLGMPASKYEEHYLANIPQFVQWYESQGHSHDEAIHKSSELTTSSKVKEEQLAFYNSKKSRGKEKEWTPKIEVFWKINN